MKEALFTPLEIMPRCSAAGLDFMEHFIKVLPFRIIPAGFNAPLEFLTGFTVLLNHFNRKELFFIL